MNIQYKKYAGPIALKKIVDYLESIGEPAPNMLLSVAFTAEDELGNIKAISVVQSLPICEPMKADPGYGHCLRELFELTQNFIHQSGAKRALAHTEHPAMKAMLENVGAVPWPQDETFFDWRRPEVVTGTTAEMVGKEG